LIKYLRDVEGLSIDFLTAERAADLLLKVEKVIGSNRVYRVDASPRVDAIPNNAMARQFLSPGKVSKKGRW
jgi:hypothetical protein